MCALRRVFPFTLLAFGIAAAFGGEARVSVSASKAVRLVVVDTGFKAVWRDELNSTLKECIRSVIERQAGEGVVVRADIVDARTAAARLNGGECDAVIVVGPERPRAFRRTETPMLAANFGLERNFESVCLIVADGDAQLRRWLHESFPVAVAAVAHSSAGASNSDASTTPPARGRAEGRVVTNGIRPSRRQD